MKNIRQENLWLRTGLIRQPITEQTYRLSTFVVKLQMEDGFLLYNTVTGCILFFENELDLINSKEILIKNWFYIPTTNFDEFLWVDFLRDKKREIVASKPTKSYIIMTTINCNARCFYCYEKGRKPITMSIKTAKELANFIIKKSPDCNIKLTWFGGEPLVNLKVIDFVCTELKNNGCIYFSHIISNGLLFTKEIIERSKTLWHLNMVQITIDGTEQKYLETKAYKNCIGDEFQRVIKNIELLLEESISVSVRLNQSLNNTQDLINLVSFLNDKFSKYKKFSVYNRLLFGEENSKINQEAYFLLKHKIIQLGLRKPKLKDTIQYSKCMADNANSFVITPDGHLGKCEHYSENNFIGSLKSEVYDCQMLDKFKETYESTPLCKTCSLYPSCVRLKMCPSEQNECSELIRADELDNIFYLMKEFYKQSIQK